jgi:hypothetical protein
VDGFLWLCGGLRYGAVIWFIEDKFFESRRLNALLRHNSANLEQINHSASQKAPERRLE